MTTQERQNARAQAADMTRVRGTSQRPQPPRDVVCQPAPRGILVTWNFPLINSDIQKWRVYKGDENTLFADIGDRGTRQCFVDSTAGTTPPPVNIFVSSMNAGGVESVKAHGLGQAIAEASSPAMPNVPPQYTTIASGGGDTTSGFVGISGRPSGGGSLNGRNSN